MPVIKILDSSEVGTEAGAMLQALYSRSSKSIVDRLDELDGEEKALKEKMKSFYVGYGHKSIGDSAHTIIYIEGISMLAAKAIEDSPLFAGQESSSRYINFAEQGITRPESQFQNEAIDLLMEAYNLCVDSLITRDIALNDLALDLVAPHIHNCNEETQAAAKKAALQDNFKSDVQRENAIKARVFDIARGLLPCGMHTQLAWTTSLSHATDQLTFLMAHPLEEVADLAHGIYVALSSKYPSSFAEVTTLSETVDYYKSLTDKGVHVYYSKDSMRQFKGPVLSSAYSTLDNLGTLKDHLHEVNLPAIASVRDKRRFPVPASVGYTLPQVEYSGVIDWASWRDLQRHRTTNSVASFPCATTKISPWYTERYAKIKNEYTRLMTLVNKAHDCNQKALVEAQSHITFDYNLAYSAPMGVLVPTEGRMNFHHLVYMLELRNTPFVHATLRTFVDQLQMELDNVLRTYRADGILLSSDKDDPAKRGDQTITEKKD